MPRGVDPKLQHETRRCDHCGAEYTPKQAGQLYCKPAHKNAAQIARRYDEAFGSRLTSVEQRLEALESNGSEP